jgi:hypothetical protein
VASDTPAYLLVLFYPALSCPVGPESCQQIDEYDAAAAKPETSHSRALHGCRLLAQLGRAKEMTGFELNR